MKGAYFRTAEFLIAFRPMTSSQVQTFTLRPFKETGEGAVRGIRGQISRLCGGLEVSYILEGELERLRVPKRRTPRFADELWRRTCFELFVARKGQPQYHEFNFSPSGEWAVYAFSRYRERVSLDAKGEPAALNPRISLHRSAGKLELDATVRLGRLSAHQAGIRLGLSAVVEEEDGSLSYWAIKHPLAQPDFHHSDAFVLEFDEIWN